MSDNHVQNVGCHRGYGPRTECKMGWCQGPSAMSQAQHRSTCPHAPIPLQAGVFLFHIPKVSPTFRSFSIDHLTFKVWRRTTVPWGTRATASPPEGRAATQALQRWLAPSGREVLAELAAEQLCAQLLWTLGRQAREDMDSSDEELLRCRLWHLPRGSLLSPNHDSGSPHIQLGGGWGGLTCK